MAFGRLERKTGAAPMSEINMTPLIDVMLVLMVIFMITAPLMGSSLKLDLPKVDGAEPSRQPRVVTLAIDRAETLYWGEQAIDRAALVQKVKAAAAEQPAPEVLLRADQALPYGRVAELIGLLQAGGLSRIGLVAETTRP